MKKLLFLLSVLLIFSCVKEQEKEVNGVEKKSELSIIRNYKPIEEVLPAFKKETESWEEYTTLYRFFDRFKKTSDNEALSNALELRDLVMNLKENPKPEIFDTPSFNTRIDILNNEALRLADMTFIPAIKAEEITKQTDKVLSAFSAVNSKINAVFSKKRFEDEIDININYIGLDTTKIDSISRITIDKKREEKILKKKNASKEELLKRKKFSKINKRSNEKI
ncbi:hypothetical protein MC378_08830 [Polaribacter sp. MSW13]|uniref:Lipoprotein n=1 Tax=Polaribacter marinus TaxID=2916838 RepID=A0A9X1VND0_9FLAO|nr:hypothetical protein [Polaribacter marinus]MCI2229266.1 hypothetical protein [Polaribacter marinus]